MAKTRRRIGKFLKWTAAVLVGLVAIVAIVAFLVIRSFVEPDTNAFGTKPDEAQKAEKKIDLRAASEPYFVDMDKGLLLPPGPDKKYPDQILQVANDSGLEPEQVRQAAIRGQNAWMIWTGGNDRFWDFAAKTAIGSFDLLKIISSHPSHAYGRHNRWRYLGLVNEPCFRKADGPDDNHFGLWIDRRDPNCRADPFGGNEKADEQYSGVKLGTRGEKIIVGEDKKELTLPVGSYYGEPTGIVGLRLFPNPDFDKKAAKKWDPVKFYTEESYYNDKNLVRPHRVGMSCAFCHVGPSPVNPPKDPENPKWSELNSNPGAQYYWVNRIFFWNTGPRTEKGKPSLNEGNTLYQLFHTNPPGSLDTSLVSTDYMNNPRTMNAVYEVRERLRIAAKTGDERLKEGELDNKQFQNYAQTETFASYFDEKTSVSKSMRVLKDGSDSVGALGALNRVYLNIGLFSEEWLLHFRPFLGGQKISPIRIADANKNSAYWRATEKMTADMAIFFLVTARADRLGHAPGGAAILAERDPVAVERGKVIFAENCAACHSSRQPTPTAEYGVDTGKCEGGGAGPHYRECWDRFAAWAKSDEFKRRMVALVTKRDDQGNETFLKGNFLSTDRRVPLDVIRTNACSAVATNGLAGDIWDNFTSSTYKTLPPPGEVKINHPVSGASMPFQPLGNGRGYMRPASLVSLWSTAPYLHNNSVGHDERYYYRSYDYGARCPANNPNDPYLPCVENRLKVFEQSIRKMLWPETRRRDPVTTEPIPGYIYRTTAPSCFKVPAGFSPDIVRNYAGVLNWLAGWAVQPDGAIHLGPLPKSFPINTLLNTKLLPDNDEPEVFRHYLRLLKAGPTIIGAFKRLGGQCSAKALADPQIQNHAEKVVRETKLIDTLIGLSKCPDYVVNRGHYFGSDLPAADKAALIEYLKQF